MSVVPYIDIGQKIDGDTLFLLVAKADSKLASIYQKQPMVLIDQTTGTGWSNPKRFYFCDTITPSDNTIFKAFMANESSGNWFRKYNHAAFETYVASLVIDSGSSPYKDDTAPVIRVVAPTDSDYASTWQPLIWPSGGGVGQKLNILDFSLEPHQITDSGKKYNINVAGNVDGQHEVWWEQVEIILGTGLDGSLTWDQKWTKYRLLRFNNLTADDFVVYLPICDADGTLTGTQNLTIEPMSSACVRRVGLLPSQGWEGDLVYLQYPLPLDPWFQNGQASNSLTQPMTYMAQLLYQPFSITPDSAREVHGYRPRLNFDKMWNNAPVYFSGNSSAGDDRHLDQPVGGWFGALNPTSKLGDMLYHKGLMIAVQPAGPFKVLRSPPIEVSVTATPGVPQSVTLRKVDGTVALGVESLTVSIMGVDIPPGSDPDVNWILSDLGTHFELGLFVRLSGATPLISTGDPVKISFKHLTDDQKWKLWFSGMDELEDQMAVVGVTVTDPDPDNPDQILLSTGDTDLDLIGLGTNLITGTAGVAAVSCADYYGNFSLPKLINMADRMAWITQDTQTATNNYRLFSWPDHTNWTITDTGESADITYDTTVHRRNVSAPDIGSFGLNKTVSQVLTALGALDLGDNTLTPAIQVTPFGPAFRCSQTWDLLYPIYEGGGAYAPLIGNPTYFDERVDIGDDGTITIVKMVFLEAYRLSVTYGNGSPCWPDLASPLNHYPRTPRVTSNIRTNTEAVNVTGRSQPSTEKPNIKSYYENKPWLDGQTIEANADVTTGGQIVKSLIGILGHWVSDTLYDVWLQLSAWVSFTPIVYMKSTGSSDVADFSKGGTEQTSYYSLNRGNLKGGITGGASDAQLGLNSLVITEDIYNTLASILNALEGYWGRSFVSEAQYGVFDGIAASHVSNGIGTCKYRPRTQFMGWTDDETWLGDTITSIIEGFGITVKTSDDFPSTVSNPISDFQNDCYFWSPPTLITNPTYYYSPGTIADYWFTYHGIGTDDLRTDDGHGYRWITIDDAKSICDQLGIPFTMSELVCPATLKIGTCSPSLVLSGGGGSHPSIASYAQWVNDPDGEWVYTPENDVIRNDVSRIDMSVIVAGNDDGVSNYGIYDMAPPSDVCERLYFVGGIANPLNPTQAIVANKNFIYRRYGMQPARAIVFPRNYFDYERDKSADASYALAREALADGLFNYIPIIAVDNLEGNDPEITACTADETAISTSIENGQLVIWQENTKFTD